MAISDRPDSMSSQSTNSDRREWLRKALAAGTIGYVAPMIVGSVTTVSAQGTSGATICPQADSCATFSCAGGCACVPTVEGPTVCIVPTCVAPCTTSADCPSGNVCFTLGCCGPATFCVPLAAPNSSCLTVQGAWRR